MLRITSTPTNPITVGSNVTLTCTVELSSAVDVPVTVNTVWTGPQRMILLSSATLIVNLTRYTSTAMVSSFGRDKSGNYTCTATVNSRTDSTFLKDSMISSTIRVTVGKFNSLINYICTVISYNTNLIIGIIIYNRTNIMILHYLGNCTSLLLYRCLPLTEGSGLS